MIFLCAGAAEDSGGSVTELKGQAYAEAAAARRTLALKAAIMLGDHVEAGDQSRVTLLLGRETRFGWAARQRRDRQIPRRPVARSLTGNPGKRPLNPAELTPEPNVPDCPAELGPLARRE
jgi:hypothetical protein